MTDTTEKPCFIGAALASNRNKSGELIEADEILQGKFYTVKNPLGSAALTEVTCDRCETTFFVREHKPGERAVVYFGWEGPKGEPCDETILNRQENLGEWVMNVNIRNIAI